MPAKKPIDIPKKYDLGIADVAKMVGVHERTIYRYLSEGRLKGHRVGPKLIRFNADEVERALVGDR
jgi:excisionase family DNA binding protein